MNQVWEAAGFELIVEADICKDVQDIFGDSLSVFCNNRSTEAVMADVNQSRVLVFVVMSRGNMSKSTSWGRVLDDQFLELHFLGFYLGVSGNGQQD